jgi:8-oxo-dGTP diphosphatase
MHMPVPTYIKQMREKIGNDLLMVVGASAIVVNEQGEILLHRRSDNGKWSLPGGSVDPGEQPADAAVREVFEETGLKVIPLRLISVYSGPELVITYPEGNQVAITSVAFLCKPVGGEPRLDGDETLEIRYFAPDKLPDNLMSNHVQRIQDALKGQPDAIFQHSSGHGG